MKQLLSARCCAKYWALCEIHLWPKETQSRTSCRLEYRKKRATPSSGGEVSQEPVRVWAGQKTKDKVRKGCQGSTLLLGAHFREVPRKVSKIWSEDWISSHVLPSHVGDEAWWHWSCLYLQLLTFCSSWIFGINFNFLNIIYLDYEIFWCLLHFVP